MSASRLGIIGAGQLGRMMALAAYPLGVECVFLDREARSPGGQVGPIRLGAFDNVAALTALAREVDVVTFDIENVPATALEAVAAIAPVRPAPAIVGIAQDRLSEKTLFRSLDVPTTAYVAIDAAEDLDRCAAELGWPVVLKARRLGYDGRGQRIAHSLEELRAGWESLGRVPAIGEGFVHFDRELSMIGVRGPEGETAFYPLTENVHRDGILLSSVAPYDDPALQRSAEHWLDEIMRRFDYQGVLTVEFFATDRGLIANEMAPRVHNSGHWTIEGAETSQFENHVRAVLGLPLGVTRARGHAAMLNLLGRMPPRASVLAVPGAHLHDYGKAPRPGRKLGHCTLVDAERASLLDRLRALEQLAAGVSA